MVGRWAVVNRVRRRDPLTSRSENPSHSTGIRTAGVGRGTSFRNGGYLGLIQMDPVEDRELNILQEPGMEENLKKRINVCLCITEALCSTPERSTTL